MNDLTVLFVDDESQVLNGIERMLDVSGVDWGAEYASSGLEALELLTGELTVDAIVTDMRMPGMDGAELLSAVSEQYPQVVRIVLSGQADKEAVFRAVSPMHQYLTKPCDAKLLKTTIQRACALREVLQSDALKKVIGGISRLPSVPSIYQEVVNELESDNASVETIGEIISQDAAMTAKILQIANSAIFGLRNPVHSAARAATFLGTDTIKSLVLTVGVFQEYEDVKVSGFSIEMMMNHSLRVGCLSKRIAMHQQLDSSDVEAAFTAGVLHDIGKFALLSTDSKGFEETLELARKDQVPSWMAEQQVYQADHASVGAHMLSVWGLPQSIIEVVALHHQPVKSCEESFSILTAVHVANEIIGLEKPGSHTERTEQLDNYLKSIGCFESLKAWQDLAVSLGDEVE